MDWKRTKFSRWKSGDFTITEVESIDRPYQLDVIDESPIAFPSLRQAQQVARLKHELNLSRQENIELRAQMNARNGHAGSALTLVEATRQPAPGSNERPTATIDLPLPEDFGLQSNGSPWPDESEYPGEDDRSLDSTSFDLDDPGQRGIPVATLSQEPSIVDSAEVEAIAARLLDVMAKNTNGNGRVPRIFAEDDESPLALLEARTTRTLPSPVEEGRAARKSN